MKLVGALSHQRLLAETSTCTEPTRLVCALMGNYQHRRDDTPLPMSTTRAVQRVNAVLREVDAPLRITEIREVFIRETQVAFVIVRLDIPGLYELGSGKVPVADYKPCVFELEEECKEVPPPILTRLSAMKPP